ncbi:MAG: hypothetical protein J1F60_03880 [Oscillospiraceae bacterium]|nr:hypothetical protein [Oscillospiraceae bacterium]
MKKKIVPWIAAAIVAIVIFLLQTGSMALIQWISDVSGISAAIAMTPADIIFMIMGLAVILTAQLAFVLFPAGVAAKRFGFSYIHLLLTLPVIYALFTVFHVRFFFLFISAQGDFFTNLIVTAVIGVVMLIAVNNMKWRIKRKSLGQKEEE